jgi:hypothetical protein
MDPLRDYFDGIKDAPVPARLMAETPPEAFLRKLTLNAAWAAAGMVLVLLVTAIPTPTDSRAAARTAQAIDHRVAMNLEVGK